LEELPSFGALYPSKVIKRTLDEHLLCPTAILTPFSVKYDQKIAPLTAKAKSGCKAQKKLLQ
jgi:hypothetical protein